MSHSTEKQLEWAERLEDALNKVHNGFYHPNQQDKIEQVIDELNQENMTDLCGWQESLEPFITEFHRNSYPYAIDEIHEVCTEMKTYNS